MSASENNVALAFDDIDNIHTPSQQSPTFSSVSMKAGEQGNCQHEFLLELDTASIFRGSLEELRKQLANIFYMTLDMDLVSNALCNTVCENGNLLLIEAAEHYPAHLDVMLEFICGDTIESIINKTNIKGDSFLQLIGLHSSNMMHKVLSKIPQDTLTKAVFSSTSKGDLFIMAFTRRYTGLLVVLLDYIQTEALASFIEKQNNTDHTFLGALCGRDTYVLSQVLQKLPEGLIVRAAFAQNSLGNTAMHIACKQYSEVIKLIVYFTNPELLRLLQIKNLNGETALHWAIENTTDFNSAIILEEFWCRFLEPTMRELLATENGAGITIEQMIATRPKLVQVVDKCKKMQNAIKQAKPPISSSMQTMLKEGIFDSQSATRSLTCVDDDEYIYGGP